MPWGKCTPVYDPNVIGLCGTPYHAHKYGCHNFCSRGSCPPTMQPLSIALDDFYLIWIKYPIGKHVRKKMEDHPDWSIYQARNVLYWQATARNQAKSEALRFLKKHSEYRVPSVNAPKVHLDSWGIDMQSTIAQVGIKLKYGPDWGIHEYTYVLRYAGTPIEKVSASRYSKLIKKFPWVYKLRIGHCEGCDFRPCLKQIKNNPIRYINQQVGPIRILRDHIQSKTWIIRYPCNHTAAIPLSRDLCLHFECPKCQ